MFDLVRARAPFVWVPIKQTFFFLVPINLQRFRNVTQGEASWLVVVNPANQREASSGSTLGRDLKTTVDRGNLAHACAPPCGVECCAPNARLGGHGGAPRVFESLGSAVAASRPGDTLWLESGAAPHTLPASGLVLPHALRLIGQESPFHKSRSCSVIVAEKSTNDRAPRHTGPPCGIPERASDGQEICQDRPTPLQARRASGRSCSPSSKQGVQSARAPFPHGSSRIDALLHLCAPAQLVNLSLEASGQACVYHAGGRALIRSCAFFSDAGHLRHLVSTVVSAGRSGPLIVEEASVEGSGDVLVRTLGEARVVDARAVFLAWGSKLWFRIENGLDERGPVDSSSKSLPRSRGPSTLMEKATLASSASPGALEGLSKKRKTSAVAMVPC